MTVCWHAGEPLVMPIDFYRSAFEISERYINNERNINQNIQTNATLITQEHCDLFKKHNVSIGVSIDGPDFIHDRNRKTRSGKGTHKQAMEGVKMLLKNGINVRVIAVLTSFTLDFPDEMYNFFVENGLRHIGFNVDEVEGTNTVSSFENAPEQKYRDFLYRFLTLVSRDSILEVREFHSLENNIKGGRGVLGNSQVNPFDIISVDTDGNFTSFSPELLAQKSEIYGDFILGNVVSERIIDCLNSPKFNRMFQDIISGVEKCRKECEYFSICGGGAPSNKYYENGSFDSTVTKYCRLTKQLLPEVYIQFMNSKFI